jgi:hypothetical protein
VLVGDGISPLPHLAPQHKYKSIDKDSSHEVLVLERVNTIHGYLSRCFWQPQNIAKAKFCCSYALVLEQFSDGASFGVSL